MNPKHIRVWLLVLVCAGATGACGDDDGGGDDDDGGGAAARCGDGRVNGDEQCDRLDLGGSECSSAGEFTGGELACADDCTFDTSGCTAADDCGNGVIDGDEQCDGTELGGMTCSAIDGFDSGELACADDCTFDTSACEAPVSPSDRIQDARDAADGDGLSLPIEGALVTYVKPVLGNDPAGFFIQAEQAGPALFVAVDAATLDPVPAAGDTVSFTITAKTTQDGQPRATALADVTIDAIGGDVAALVQDIGAATNLLDPIAGFDSELVAMDATIVADFGFAGSGAEAANIATEGLPEAGEIHPRFRLDAALRDSLDLASGCVVRIGPTPLWRFQDTAQPSIWAGGEVAIQSCTPPRVVSVVAPASTIAIVTFDRRIDPGSVEPADFAFTNGLSATAAAVDANNGRQINLTTTAQTTGTTYTLTVTDVTDLVPTPIDPAANTGDFTGFGSAEAICDDNTDNDNDGELDCFDSDCALAAACDFASQLYLWEIDPDQTGTDTAEFVEVVNKTGVSVDLADQGWYVLLVNGNGEAIYGAFSLLGPGGGGTIAPDDVWVVGSAGLPGDNQEVLASLQNGTDGVLLVRCDDCTGADDFGSEVQLGTGTTFASASGQTATKMDAIVYGPDDDPELRGVLNVTEQFMDTPAGSLQRTFIGGWLLGPTTPGDFD